MGGEESAPRGYRHHRDDHERVGCVRHRRAAGELCGGGARRRSEADRRGTSKDRHIVPMSFGKKDIERCQRQLEMDMATIRNAHGWERLECGGGLRPSMRFQAGRS